MRFAKPGDVLGLSAALSNSPYEVTAEASEVTQIKTLPREEFLEFLMRHGHGNLNAISSLNTEYRTALSHASRLALSNTVAAKLAQLILQMAVEAGTADDSKPSVHLSLRHEDLASMLGNSRESISRALGELKERNLIAVQGTRITILNKEVLESLQ